MTDTCKYFFVYNSPVNISYIAGAKPCFDPESKYIEKATEEYNMLRDKFGDDGVLSFIDNIATIGVSGMVDGERMLRCAHQYDEKHERKAALNAYREWQKDQTYLLNINDDDGNPHRQKCTKYIYHDEAMRNEHSIHVCARANSEV